MAPKASKRRSPGEGSVWPYQTKAGERWAIGHPSFGTRRNASGWAKTKRTAQQAAGTATTQITEIRRQSLTVMAVISVG